MNIVNLSYFGSPRILFCVIISTKYITKFLKRSHSWFQSNVFLRIIRILLLKSIIYCFCNLFIQLGKGKSMPIAESSNLDSSILRPLNFVIQYKTEEKLIHLPQGLSGIIFFLISLSCGIDCEKDKK